MTTDLLMTIALGLALAGALALLVLSVLAVRAGVKAGAHEAVVRALRKNTRRIIVLIAGTTVIIVGIIISPLPGPGLSILGPIGFAILASEFVWAKRLAAILERHTTGFRSRADALARRTSRWLAVAVSLSYWTIAVLVAIALADRVHQLVIWPVASVGFAPIFYWAAKVWKLSGTTPEPGADAPAE